MQDKICITKVFKGLLKEQVYLYEVRYVSESLTDSIPLGTVTVNMSNGKACVQVHNILRDKHKDIVEKCIKISENIIDVIE